MVTGFLSTPLPSKARVDKPGAVPVSTNNQTWQLCHSQGPPLCVLCSPRHNLFHLFEKCQLCNEGVSDPCVGGYLALYTNGPSRPLLLCSSEHPLKHNEALAAGLTNVSLCVQREREFGGGGARCRCFGGTSLWP